MIEADGHSGPSVQEVTSTRERLRASAELIVSDECPECPVCLEIPTPLEARILRCCATIMCRACIPLCQGVCPFCRRTFEELGESCSHSEVDQVIRALTTGEMPHTYPTHEYTSRVDYSMHLPYEVSVDYTSTLDYTTASNYHVSGDYTPKLDYSVGTDYNVSNDYSLPANQYVARDYNGAATTDYSDITDRYLST
mmetsp:Transcript_22466/g.68492  ORF Transcript_22466/g.68492 Transcript_22466/m.68492 type:complete len:196 (-) Transcript_22466:158-745(-)|eukprot:scaffold314775_cov44-Tisochrysis_lutea.AAC.2